MAIRGYPDSTWSDAKAQALEELVKVVRSSRHTIFYSELADRISSIKFEADDPTFHYMLGEISKQENAAGRGMLSVAVVHKDRDMRPGAGFYKLAKELGKDLRDPDKFWAEEFRLVQNAWRHQP